MNIKSLFSPLSGEYCVYFYYLSVLNLLLLIGIAFMLVVTTSPPQRQKDKLITLTLILPLFMGYFVNRLLYSMCIGSVK
jgi:hypothetical protein